MNYLFVDIETFGNKPRLEDVKVPSTYKKADSIAKYQFENLDKQWRKNALDSMNARILCISFALNDGPVQTVSGEEDALMKEFDDYLATINPLDTAVVAHNGLNFDFPFIIHRAFRDSLRNVYKMFTFKGKTDPRLKDTQDIWKHTDYKAYHSFDSVARFLGLEGKGEIDGSMVHDLYLNGEIDRICEYCEDDVEKMRKVFYHLQKVMG